MQLRLAIGLCLLATSACVSPPPAVRFRGDAGSVAAEDASTSPRDAGGRSEPVARVTGMRGTVGVAPAVVGPSDAGVADGGVDEGASLPPYDAGGMPCFTNPCLNGGDCILMTGGVLCVCPPPYYGAICQLSD